MQYFVDLCMLDYQSIRDKLLREFVSPLCKLFLTQVVNIMWVLLLIKKPANLRNKGVPKLNSSELPMNYKYNYMLVK